LFPYLDSDSASSLVRPKYVVYGKNIDSGYLKHVYAVLERAGFERANYNSTDDWAVMWAHVYPFRKN
jgi:tubulin monoglycylase TTLL15